VDLAADYERRIAFQADVQDYVDQAISSTINLPSWGSELNNEDTVDRFAETLARYAPRLRGFTCYPDGARGGQPLTSVPYREAVGQLGQEFREEVVHTDVCDLSGGGNLWHLGRPRMTKSTRRSKPDQGQKDATLAILGDLLQDHREDQLARTSLSNAIALAEATMVTGELDAMIQRTNKMWWRSAVAFSVFFVAFAAAQFWFGYTTGSLAYYVFGLATAFYAFALFAYYRITWHYHTQLKWLASLQLVLPTIPGSLIN
jgi:hypothetical protein